MGQNRALNRPTQTSSYVMPYSASKAVDGNTAPINRWVCNTLPGWISVDLGTAYYINQWVVKQMQVAGWPPTYNLVDYRIDGSMDNANWTTVDSITNNNLQITNKYCTPFKARYVRLYVTKGIRVNPQLASLMEFEVYDTDPTSSYLTGITLSSGTLNPNFSEDMQNYTTSVTYDIQNISVLAQPEDNRAIVYVNGIIVPNGKFSQPIALQVGNNNVITIRVQPYAGDPRDYTITVTRASDTHLSGLTVRIGKSYVTLTPTFDKDTFGYSGTVGSVTSAGVTATAADAANSNITISGTPATSGLMQNVTLNSRQVNNIPVVVNSKIGSDSKTYTIALTVG